LIVGRFWPERMFIWVNPKVQCHKPGQKAPESGQYGVVGPKVEKPGLKSPLPKAKPCRQRQNPARDLSWWTRPNTKMTNDSAKDDASLEIFQMKTLILSLCNGYFYKWEHPQYYHHFILKLIITKYLWWLELLQEMKKSGFRQFRFL